MSGLDLKSYLQRNNCFESSVESDRKKVVIENLKECFTNWVKKFPPDKLQNEECLGRLLTLGSYKMGTDGPGADIDVLLIVPHGLTISRNDSFLSFYDFLHEQSQLNLSYYRKIENTYVPVIKATINSVDIDIAFCCFAETIPSVTELLSDIHLKNMDVYSIRSLNGYRDCAYILQFIGSNIEQFRTVLRAVKLWASRRAIYNNSIGYFSGMALTVLVAQVILEFPNADECFQLLREFFKKYSNWKWPRPVMLHYLESNHKDAPVLKVWNPHIYSFDKEDKMPILTPTYPQRNASYTATISTRRIIVKEFKRATQLIKMNRGLSLDVIFAPQEFFSERTFGYYIILSAESMDDSINHHWDWCAVVRAQIRKLIGDMELLNSVQNLHPYPNAYPYPDSSNLPPNYFHSVWYIGVSLNPTYAIENVDIPGYLLKFKLYVAEYAENHDIQIAGRSVDAKLIEKQFFSLNLPLGIGCGIKNPARQFHFKLGKHIIEGRQKRIFSILNTVERNVYLPTCLMLV